MSVNYAVMRRRRRRPASARHILAQEIRSARLPPLRPVIPRNIAKALKGVEKKWISREKTATNIAQVWTGGELNPTDGCLTGITQGDGDSERIGKSVSFDSLYVHGILSVPALDSTAVQNPILVRLVFFMDTQTNGVAANAEDVMDNTGTNKYLAFRNPLFFPRFRVLYDRTIVVRPTAAAGNGTADDTASSIVPFKWGKTNMNMNVTFSAATSLVGSVTNNSVQCCAVANVTGCNILYRSRAYYFD